MVKWINWLLRLLWSAWGFIVFTITLLMVTPLYLVLLYTGGRQRQQSAHKLSRLWAKGLFFALFIRFEVHGEHLLNTEQTYIFVANHASQLDIPALTLATRHFFKFLAKAELTKVPLLGKIIDELYLTVDRKSPRARAKSMEKMREALNAGTSVVIFPEGSRNLGPEPLQRFHDGAFSLSRDSGYPLAVLTIVGSAECLPTKVPFQLRPGVIRCYWETVLAPEAPVANLKAEARAAMWERLTHT